MKKRQPHWLEDAECRLVLSKNCRNTAEIFKTACSIIGKENLTLNEIHGEVPFLRFYSTEKEMTAIVEGFLERMKRERYQLIRLPFYLHRLWIILLLMRNVNMLVLSCLKNESQGKYILLL